MAKAPLNSLIYTNPEREANVNDDGTLFAYNGTGGNDAQLKAVLAAYPELSQMLQDDYSSPAKDKYYDMAPVIEQALKYFC